VLAVSAISFAAIFFRKAAPTPPLVAAGVRLAIATLILAPWVVRARRAGRLPSVAVRYAVGGGVAYAVHFGAWVTSLTLTSVAASVTLVTATPMLLALVAWVTGRDRPTRRQWLALALAAVGVAILGGLDVADDDALLGDGLALLGASAMAAYMLLARRAVHETAAGGLDSWGYSGVATGVGAVLLLGSATLVGLPIRFAGWEPLGYVVLATLLPQLVGHGLLTWALRHTRPTVVGIATLGEPVGSTLLAWWWLEEGLQLGTFIGCAVTLVAVALAMTRRAAV
jgi:drug/metabolite transporter (DMT)-like permease